VVSTGAIGDERIVAGARFGLGAADQLLRLGPGKTHAALGRVHGFGYAEAEIP
jgi:hypothetical protein